MAEGHLSCVSYAQKNLSSVTFLHPIQQNLFLIPNSEYPSAICRWRNQSLPFSFLHIFSIQCIIFFFVFSGYTYTYVPRDFYVVARIRSFLYAKQVILRITFSVFIFSSKMEQTQRDCSFGGVIDEKNRCKKTKKILPTFGLLPTLFTTEIKKSDHFFGTVCYDNEFKKGTRKGHSGI